MKDSVTPQNGTHPKQSNHMNRRSPMDTTNNENIAQAAYDRIADTERHLRRHTPRIVKDKPFEADFTIAMYDEPDGAEIPGSGYRDRILPDIY
jgi:hypothetical protein